MAILEQRAAIPGPKKIGRRTEIRAGAGTERLGRAALPKFGLTRQPPVSPNFGKVAGADGLIFGRAAGLRFGRAAGPKFGRAA